MPRFLSRPNPVPFSAPPPAGRHRRNRVYSPRIELLETRSLLTVISQYASVSSTTLAGTGSKENNFTYINVQPPQPISDITLDETTISSNDPLTDDTVAATVSLTSSLSADNSSGNVSLAGSYNESADASNNQGIYHLLYESQIQNPTDVTETLTVKYDIASHFSNTLNQPTVNFTVKGQVATGNNGTMVISVKGHSKVDFYALVFNEYDFTTSTDSSSCSFSWSLDAPQSLSTQTTVTSASNPSTYGQPVTFTATVTPTVASNDTPAGTIQFAVDGLNYGDPVTLIGGEASISDSMLSVDGSPHAVVATYEPATSASFTASTGILADGQTVTNPTPPGMGNPPPLNVATPTVSVSDAGGKFNGKPFPATATVAGIDGQPAASLEGVSPTLTYYAGNTASGTALPGAPSAAGTYTVVAYFPGSTDYASANAMTSFVINQSPLLPTGSFTAYRPITANIDFTQYPIPQSEQVSKGVGIRVDGEDNSSHGLLTGKIDPDLIAVFVNVSQADPADSHYIIQSSTPNLIVWADPTKTKLVLSSGAVILPTPSPLSVLWVEWLGAKPGVGTLSLLAVSNATGQSTTLALLNFHTFTTDVILFTGEDAFDGIMSAHGLGGMLNVMTYLYENGYDVHLFTPSEGTRVVLGKSLAYDEVYSAAKHRGVTHFSIVGFSHGGGATYDLSAAISSHRLLNSKVTLDFTGYIDAIKDSISLDTRPETRKPVGSKAHVNIFESNSTNAIKAFSRYGLPVKGATNINLTSFGYTHHTIMADPVVQYLMESYLITVIKTR